MMCKEAKPVQLAPNNQITEKTAIPSQKVICMKGEDMGGGHFYFFYFYVED